MCVARLNHPRDDNDSILFTASFGAINKLS